MNTTITAADLMARKVITLSPDQYIYDAMEVLVSHGISGAPVIERGRLVGVLSEYDCLRVGGAGMTDMFEPTSGPVRQYMCQPVFTHVDTPLSELTTTLISQRIRRLPVVDDDQRVVGVVSRRDVLRGLIQNQSGRRPQQRYPDYRRPQ